MECEKLCKLNKTTLSSNDNFGWDVICYEDVTEIVYFEKDSEGKRTREDRSLFTVGYDLQVFEEAIKLRKQNPDD